MMLKIKKLTDQDIHLLHACAELAKICLPGEAWSFESFLSETRKSGGFIWIALDQDQPAGFLTACQILDSADLTNIGVLPDYRRQGIGSRLLETLLNQMQNTSIFLEVRASNKSALDLYQKAGFYEIGIRKRFYQHPEEDAVLMRRENYVDSGY